MTSSGQAEVRIKQGTVGDVGAARVGLTQVRDGAGVLVVSRAGLRGGPRVQMSVREGDLVPLGGGLYRVTSVEKTATDDSPGASSGAVCFEATPTRALDPHTLAVPVGATANAAGFDLSVMTLGGDGTANVELWPDEFARPQTRPELIQTVAVKRGGSLPTGGQRLAVVNIVQPDPGSGLCGFVEFQA
jgi:hypothetical protein